MSGQNHWHRKIDHSLFYECDIPGCTQDSYTRNLYWSGTDKPHVFMTFVKMEYNNIQEENKCLK